MRVNLPVARPLPVCQRDVQRLQGGGQIRLTLRPQPSRRAQCVAPYFTDMPASGFVEYARRGDGVWESHGKKRHCPYGVPATGKHPGTVVWLQEPWKIAYVESGIATIAYHGPNNKTIRLPDGFPADCFWRESTRMPRWASRVELQLVGVSVERLHCSEDDLQQMGYSSATTFRQQWDKHHHGPYRWEANPYCWVLTLAPT